MKSLAYGLIVTMVASFYGYESGPVTADGTRWDPQQNWVAHKTLPFGTRLKICRENDCVIATVKDRGPYIEGRDIDLSLGIAQQLNMVSIGVGEVEVTRLYPTIPNLSKEFKEVLSILK